MSYHPAGHESPRTRQLHIAANPETSAVLLRKLATLTEDRLILTYLAENRSTPADTLKALSLHESQEIRTAVADNPCCPKETLKDLAKDDSADLRFAMAENHCLAEDLLHDLAMDANPWVKDRAEKTLARLAEEAEKAKAQLNLPCPKPIRVLLAEDNDFIRSLIKKKISQDRDIEVVAEVNDGKAAVISCLQNNPSLVLMDMIMPELDGIQATNIIKTQRPYIKVVMVTGCDSDEKIIAALNAGADGYFLKVNALDKLTACIEAVAAGGSWLDPAISTTILRECFIPTDAEAARKSVEKSTNVTDSIEELVAAGKYGHAIRIARSAYDYAVERFGPDSEEAINLLCQAAELYYMNKDFANAERYYLHVLEVRQEILMNADQKTNSVLRVLGKMCESTGNLHQAELYYSWALRISERMEDHYRVDEIHNKLNQIKSLKRSRESHKELRSP